MNLLVVIPLVWVAVVAVTMALLRMAAVADADAERRAQQEHWRRAADRLRGRASEPGAGERPAATRH